MKQTILLTLTSALLISGCAAVWGGAHNIVEADDRKIVIQYDSGLTSSVRTAALAKEHCKKFDKEAEGFHSEMPGILLGIIQDTYQCVAKK
jgi:hypothetical protein